MRTGNDLSDQLAEFGLVFGKGNSVEHNLLAAIMFFVASICLTGRTDLLRRLAHYAQDLSQQGTGADSEEWPSEIGEQ